MLGKRLLEARKRKGLTQKELGDLIGVTNAAISGYERDKRIPDPPELIKLANILDVSIDWLLGRAEHNTAFDDYRKKKLIENFDSLSPEEQKAVEIMIDTLLAAKKEQAAAGE